MKIIKKNISSQIKMNHMNYYRKYRFGTTEIQNCEVYCRQGGK